MKGRLPAVRRGDPITARMLDKLAKGYNSSENATNGGRHGLSTSSFNGQSNPRDQGRVIMVEMIRNAIPTNHPDYYDVQKNPPNEENAFVIEYDVGAGDYAINRGKRVVVKAIGGIPILRGDQLSVRFDAKAAAYVPLAPPAMRIVRLANDGSTGSGAGTDLLDAYVQNVDSITPLSLSDDQQVWAVNLNG